MHAKIIILPPGAKKHLRPLAAILLVLAASHGLLLINDVRVQDDWDILHLLVGRDWNGLFHYHLTLNKFLDAFYYWPFSVFADPVFAFRVADFASWTLAAVFLYGILVTSRLLSRWESAWVAMLSGTYPGYFTHWSLNLSIYTFCYGLFFGAAWLALLSERDVRRRFTVLRVVACIGFFLSFALNSLLVFYSGFVLLHERQFARENGQSMRTALPAYVLQRVEFLLLPFAFWSTKWLTAAFVSVYAEYNAISFSARLLHDEYLSYAAAIAHQLYTLFWSPPFGIVLVTVGAVLVFRHPNRTEPVPTGSANAWLLAAGIGLLIAGTLPYVLVGKAPHGDFYQTGTRSNELVGLPMALIMLALLRFAESWIPPVGRFRFAILLAVVCAGAWIHVRNYVTFQASSIEDRAIEASLAAQGDEARRYSVFGIVVPRLFSVWTTRGVHIWSWPYFLHEALGDGLSRAAIMEPYGTQPENRRNSPYTLEEVRKLKTDLGHWGGAGLPLDGLQATLVIEPGPLRMRFGDARLDEMYLIWKWFRPADMDAFLRDVVSVQIIPKSAQ